MPIAGTSPRPRFYYGWYLVAFAFIAQIVGGPYIFGVFYKPMTEDLGWSRGEFALANTFAAVIGGVIGFFVGPIVDGQRARWLIVSGALVAGLSLIGTAFVDEIWQFWVIRGLIYMIGSAGMSPIVVNAILSKWFVRQRGRAIAIASMGLSMGAILLSPAIAFFIEAFGWRAAWAAYGVLTWAVMVIPAALIVKRQPEDIGLLPDGDTEESLERARAELARKPRRWASSEEEWTRGEALRTRELWLLIAIFGLGSLPAAAIVLHLIPFLQDAGFSIGAAVLMVSFQNLISLGSKPIWGYYFDQLDPRHLSALGWGVKIIPLAAMPFVGNDFGLLPMLLLLALYGVGVGSTQTGQEVIWAHYFGRRHIGAVRSISMPFTIIFSAGGTWFAGAAWDVTGSYTFAFVLFAALTLLAVVLILVSRPPTRAPSPPDVAPPPPAGMPTTV